MEYIWILEPKSKLKQSKGKDWLFAKPYKGHPLHSALSGLKFAV